MDFEKQLSAKFCDGAVMAYQDAADFIGHLHDECEIDDVKDILRTIADSFHAKAQNAKVMTYKAKHNIK